MRIRFCIIGLMMMAAPLAVAFQGSVTRGPILEPRDPELEEEAHHNLEVARFYVKKKKWVAARTRLQEIVAKNPNFSEIAEVYFLLGKVYSKTDEWDLALELYSRVVEEFPQTKFAKKARARIQELSRKEKTKKKTNHRQQKKEAQHVDTCGGIGRV